MSDEQLEEAPKRGRGRPKGSTNKTTLAQRVANLPLRDLRNFAAQLKEIDPDVVTLLVSMLNAPPKR